jgi:hypothetical protein
VNVRLSAAGTATNTLRYYVKSQGRAIARVWVFEVRGTIGSGPGSVTFKPGADPTSSSWVVEPEAYGARGAPIVIVEGAGVNAALTRSSTAAEISCLVTCGAGFLDVISCAVWELPRVALERDSTDQGTARDTLFPRRPIYSESYVSVGGVGTLAFELCKQRRTRSGLIGRWGARLDVTSGTATSLHVVDYPVVPGYDRSATETVTCRIYAAVSAAGTAGEWRVVTGSGGASAWQTITLSTTTAQWWGPLDVALTPEDQSTTDGQPVGGADTLRFEARVSAGAGTVYVWGWGAYEKG